MLCFHSYLIKNIKDLRLFSFCDILTFIYLHLCFLIGPRWLSVAVEDKYRREPASEVGKIIALESSCCQPKTQICSVHTKDTKAASVLRVVGKGKIYPAKGGQVAKQALYIYHCQKCAVWFLRCETASKTSLKDALACNNNLPTDVVIMIIGKMILEMLAHQRIK